jgi:uncharacterized membrane protein
MASVDPAAGADAPADAFSRAEPPLWEITLWPHRSLPRRGFRWFMGLLVLGLSIPLITVWDTPIVWVLLPFEVLAVALVWGALWFSYRQGRVHEALRLWPDLITVERTEPDGHIRRWAANPYWVRVALSDTAQVSRYLTLSGAGRTIELGAFLTPEEREALADALRMRLAGLGRG